MKIPKKVRIGVYYYNIVYKDKIMDDKGNECEGICDRESHTIYLDKELIGNKKFLVFIHECLHAIEDVFDINLGEKKVARLDHALTQLFLDNDIKL